MKWLLTLGGLAAFAVVMTIVGLVASAGASGADITITGTGKVKYRPDVAHIGLGVSADGTTAAEAWQKQADAVKRLFAMLKKLGIEERDIQTTGINISPRHRTSQGDPQQLIGYTASYDLAVTVHDLNLLGKLLDNAVASGANRNVSIRFGCADPEKMLEQARSTAIADARKRAEVYVKGAGAALYRVKAIQEGDVPQWRMHRFDLAVPAGLEAAKVLSVAAGEQEVTAQVTVTWTLRQ